MRLSRAWRQQLWLLGWLDPRRLDLPETGRGQRSRLGFESQLCCQLISEVALHFPGWEGGAAQVNFGNALAVPFTVLKIQLQDGHSL